MQGWSALACPPSEVMQIPPSEVAQDQGLSVVAVEENLAGCVVFPLEQSLAQHCICDVHEDVCKLLESCTLAVTGLMGVSGDAADGFSNAWI
jgi:hypothetical protein